MSCAVPGSGLNCIFSGPDAEGITGRALTEVSRRLG